MSGSRSLIVSSFAALLLTGCATLAPCPNNLLPIVEIQVNNSASNHDDYGTTASATLPVRARITNPTGFNNTPNFSGGVTVEVRNAAGFSDLAFATASGGATSASRFFTLPGAGGWTTFYVRGNTSSTTDKSAPIEIATSGSCDETVLARKALMIPPGAPPIPPAVAQQFELEVNHSAATLDDYVAWSPMPARIRWINGLPANSFNVTLRNMTGTNRLRFASGALAAGQTANGATLPLTLSGDGAWVNFFVTGNFQNESLRDKDAVIEVIDAGNSAVLSREGMMVRIRKNANAMQAPERDRYLNALKTINMTYIANMANADYIAFVKTHSRDTSAVASTVSHRQAHGGSAFLPWHRAFVLHLERLLQAADPSVALPYWKFDVSSPNMFNAAYMGGNNPNPALNSANLAATNPIVSWSIAPDGVPGTGIQRRTP